MDIKTICIKKLKYIYKYVYHRCFSFKTLFRLTAFHCSQKNLRTDLQSLKILIAFLKLCRSVLKFI